MGLFDRLRSSDDRVVLIGIDGVPFSLVDEHPDVFPNLHAIADDGTATAIESIAPPESSACWPSLTTGVNPGSTGVYGFQDRTAETYDTYIPMGTHVKATRVWDRVTDAGKRAMVVNVPVTFPPDSGETTLISGFLSPDLEAACPDPAIRRELESLDYRIDVDARLGHEDDKTDFIADAHATLEARFEAFCQLIDTDDWDLFIGVFMTTDRINHFLFGDYETGGDYADEFLAFYRQLDGYLGTIAERLDDDTTMLIAADHGFTTLEHEVDCNAFLEEQGWLRYRDDDHEALSDIDPTSTAYSLIPGRFYLNLEGREPGGSVPTSEYEDRLDSLIEEIDALRGPDGRQVARRIIRGDELFTGAHTEIAPDLVVIPADGFDLKAGFGESDAVFSAGPRNGMHTFENACLVADTPLKTNDVDLYDLAPTILELLNIEYDGEMLDGESLVST